MKQKKCNFAVSGRSAHGEHCLAGTMSDAVQPTLQLNTIDASLNNTSVILPSIE